MLARKVALLIIGLGSLGCGTTLPQRRVPERSVEIPRFASPSSTQASPPAPAAPSQSELPAATPPLQVTSDIPGITPASGSGLVVPVSLAMMAGQPTTPSSPQPQPPNVPTTTELVNTPTLPAKSPAALTAGSPLVQLRGLQRRAVERYAGIDSYIARFRRREQVNGKNTPEEIIEFRFRKQPWSVYFKWIGTEGHDRECVYVKGRYENKIHTLLAPSDPGQLLMGKVVSLDPDNIMVRSRSRHPVSEAGIGSLIESFGRLVDAEESGQSRSLKYVGLVKRPECDQPVESVEQIIAPKQETLLPDGGRRWWFFDPTTQLPTLIITANAAGQEVEYYSYDRLKIGALDDDDFDPTKLWKNKK